MEQYFIKKKLILEIIQKHPSYYQKFLELFTFPKKHQVSIKHIQYDIIINPKNLFKLINSNQLKAFPQQNQIKSYLYLKIQIMNCILNLIDNFPLNARLLYQQSNYYDQNNQKIDFFTFLVKQIYDCVEKQLNLPKQQHILYSKLKKCQLKIYQHITSICTIKTQHLKLVTQKLTDHYYKNQVNFQNIQMSYKMLKINNLDPYLYFLDLPNEGIKIIMRITIWVWFEVLKETHSKIFWLKTQENNQITIQAIQGKLFLNYLYKNQDQETKSFELFNITPGIVYLLAIQLQAVSEKLFGSSQQKLNINKDVVGAILFSMQIKLSSSNVINLQSPKLPRFYLTEHITQLSWFYNFIGKCYSILISNSCQINTSKKLSNFSSGISNQQLIQKLFDQNSVKNQNIVCLLNADRSFQGLLLNCISDRFHGCYSGGITKNIYKNNLGNIVLPYLYFLCLIENSEKRQKLFGKILIKYIDQMTDNQQISKDQLFILYFLEQIQYTIKQEHLLKIIKKLKNCQNFYFKIILDFLDYHLLLNKGYNLGIQVIDIDPVKKIMLLYYLESMWKDKWNQFQGFGQWWSPSFLKSQIDLPFIPQKYHYLDSQKYIEWSVHNFTTNDHCKCLLTQIFKTPSYAQLNNRGNQYRKKQLMNESFQIFLQQSKQNKSLIFQKKSKSKLDKLKNIILRNNKQPETLKQKKYKQLKQQIKIQCSLIQLLTITIGELIILKNGWIMFTMKHNSKIFDHMCIKAFLNQKFVRISFNIKQTKLIRRRRYNQSMSCLQFRLKSGQIYLFYFFNKNLQKCIQILKKVIQIRKNPYQHYLNSTQTFDWIDKKLSNFQYLMWLNDVSGRSYFDITQYPVLPWIAISNDNQLNLQSSSSYRQLSKNMGSFGLEDRIKRFLENYHSQNQSQIFNQYHFGTHYSSSAIIFNYLIRLHPFSLGASTLQSGKFDCADRVFGSYIGSWINATTSSTDVRQLLPQVYTLPQMFINYNNYDFGITQNKQRIDNVDLPKWSNNNPYLFIIKLRQALENKIVSQNINGWIDLIFGYKQRGKQAVKHMNIYFPLTYQDSICLDNIQDIQQRISIETQIAHFGQNPSQIIGNNPHPQRIKFQKHWEGKLLPDINIQPSINKFALPKISHKNHQQLFNSVFESRDSIIAIKFINQQWFIVLQKYQFCVFKILDKKSNFISKEQQIQYKLEDGGVKFDYRNLANFVPIICLKQKIILVGGFYLGYVQMLFIQEPKFNQAVKLPHSTITAMNYYEQYNYLYIGDSLGKISIYELNQYPKYIEFVSLKSIDAHCGRLNFLSINQNANLFCTCGEDGLVNVYNLYSFQLYRTFHSPNKSPISFSLLTTCPLYGIVFYCHQQQMIYSYSINGQFLQKIQEKSRFLYNFSILISSHKMQHLAYVNNFRQIYIVELPLLRSTRKIKIRKDQLKISCIEYTDNSSIAVAGGQDGVLHLISDGSLF